MRSRSTAVLGASPATVSLPAAGGSATGAASGGDDEMLIVGARGHPSARIPPAPARPFHHRTEQRVPRADAPRSDSEDSLSSSSPCTARLFSARHDAALH